MQNKRKSKPQKKKTKRKDLVYNHEGHILSPLEARFIDLYMELGNGAEAVRQAGYKTKSFRQYSNTLLTKEYISSEIAYRAEQLKSQRIASATEVMEYFSAVMRGEVKDQFGLEAPLSERTKAAQEIAKRTVDIENRLAGKQEAEVTIKLDWKR